MKNISLFLFLVFGLLLLSCGEKELDDNPEEKTSIIEGEIVNLATQEPIENASVWLRYTPCSTCYDHHKIDRSDHKGEFHFSFTYRTNWTNSIGVYIGSDALHYDYTYPVVINGEESMGFLSGGVGEFFLVNQKKHSIYIELTPK